MIRVTPWLAAIFALVAAAGSAAAPFGDRPITIVVSTPPGGGVDRIARLFGERLERSVGRNVIVENRPGAAGRIATDHVARAAGDGDTLLLTTGSSIIDLAFHPALKPNAIDDLVPVSLLVIDQPVLLVLPSSPADGVRTLVTRARATPGAMSFAAVGPLSTMRIVGELFQLRTGSMLLPVPYKGEADVMRALIARDVDMAFVSMSTAQPFIEAGTVRALAVASDRRSPRLADVPTFAEAGVPDVEANIWYGLFAPGGTPLATTAALAQAASEITNEARYRSTIESTGLRPVTSAPADFGSMLRGELVRYRKVIGDAKLKVD